MSQVGIVRIDVYDLHLPFLVDHFELKKLVSRLFLLRFGIKNLPVIALADFLSNIMHADLGTLGLAIKGVSESEGCHHHDNREHPGQLGKEI